MTPTPVPPGPVPPGPVPPAPPVAVAAPPGPGPVPTPILPVDSQHQAMNEACRNRLKQLNFPLGKPLMALMKEPGKLGQPMDVETNVYGIELAGDTTIHCYNVDMASELPNGKTVVFTKQGRDDFVVLDRHRKCIDIYKKALEDAEDFFQVSSNGQGNRLVYDGQKLLFSFEDLFAGVEKKTRTIELDTTNLGSLGTLEKVMVTVTESQRPTIEFSRENLLHRTADGNLIKNDRSLSQFLEIAMNQNCILEPKRFGVLENGKVYILQPTLEKNYCANDCASVGDGKQLLPGIKKTVNFIEGPGGRGHNNPSIVIDAMKAAFHVEQTAFEKCKEIVRFREGQRLDQNSLETCIKVMKGLDCYSTYTNRTRHLVIKGIYKDGAKDTEFELPDGERITVADYFMKKYNIRLNAPHFNLLICKEGTRQNYYPMELMTITPHQRVKISQLTSQQSRVTTKQCAVLPDERKRLILAGAGAAEVNNSNDLLKALKITVFDPMLSRGRFLDGEKVKYFNHMLTSDKGKWRFQKDKFLIAAKPPKIWALYAIGTPRSRFTEKNLHDFGKSFLDLAKNQGLNFPNPVECQLLHYEEVENKIRIAAENQCEYVFVITDDNITDLHSNLKMMERNFNMVIQDCKMKTAENILGAKRLALENVMMKVNMKLGGLNYAVMNETMKESHLIVGIGITALQSDSKNVSDSMKTLNPSAIGYSSNAVHFQTFAGDFILTPLGQDSIVAIEEIMKNVITAFQKSRKTDPQRIIVYRSGASEGSYESILTNEVPLARAAIRGCGVEDNLIYIVASKDHAFRFFKHDIQDRSGSGSGSGSSYSRSSGNSGSAAEQNVPPGLILDTVVTHPSYKMFFMNSHTTIQGSAKTPSYTVLTDDSKAPLDKLEELTFALCHHHQIVTLTTSLPSPLYIANEYAKRGRALWLERTKSPVSTEKDSDRDRLAIISDELSYKQTKFANQRVNA